MAVDGEVVVAQPSRASPHEYDAAQAAEAQYVQCGKEAEEVGCCWSCLVGRRQASRTDEFVRAGTPEAPCGTATFWNPLLGGVVSNSLSPLLGRSLGRWATFFGLEGAGFEPEPASE